MYARSNWHINKVISFFLSFISVLVLSSLSAWPLHQNIKKSSLTYVKHITALQDQSNKIYWNFYPSCDRNFKMDSAESSSNKCKNYVLKIYSQHINFWTLFKTSHCSSFSLQVTPRWNPQAFERNLMSNLVKIPHACVTEFSTNAKRAFWLKYVQLLVQLSLAGSACELKSR